MRGRRRPGKSLLYEDSPVTMPAPYRNVAAQAMIATRAKHVVPCGLNSRLYRIVDSISHAVRLRAGGHCHRAEPKYSRRWRQAPCCNCDACAHGEHFLCPRLSYVCLQLVAKFHLEVREATKL